MNDERIESLLTDLGLLPIRHEECEDPWYSCPKSEFGCLNSGAGTDCNCGAEWRIGQVRQALRRAVVEALRESITIAEAKKNQAWTHDYNSGIFDVIEALRARATDLERGK